MRRPHVLTPFAPSGRSLVQRIRGDIGPGTVIKGVGAYKILRLLGSGGMGSVYLVEKRGVHGFSKVMAMKVLPKANLKQKEEGRMFLDEARLTAGLNHPNIVQTYQLGESKNDYFIVMELVFGVTLLEFLERHEELQKPVPVGYGVYIILRILSGLHYAHNKHDRDGVHLGIVHRDICPSNVLIAFRGVPKLSDFGVAKAKTSLKVDESATVFGKYPYMAPEQVRREGTSPRSDIYSTGLTMYELFTGRLVHEVVDTGTLLDELDHKAVPPPRELNPDLPEELSRIIMKAIELDPERRFRNAKTMRNALESLLLDLGMFPDTDGLADYLSALFPQAKKHRWW